MNRKNLLKISMLILGCTNQTLAQIQTLDPITVTASLSETRSSETGRNIVIVSGSEISKLPVHSLDELLKYIPGVEVQSRGPQGSQSDISIRGGTYQQVLVIMDGMRLNDPNTGHFSAYIPITPAQIERIEVLKGASAAIYGADAVGGVINIISKTFSNAQQPNKQVAIAQVGVGDFNLTNMNVGGYFQGQKLSVDGGLLSNQSAGSPQRGENGYFYNTTGSIGLHYHIAKHWNLSARSTYDNRNFAAQNFYTTFVSDTASEKVTSWWCQTKVDYQNKQMRLSIQTALKTLSDQYAFNSRSTANQNQSTYFQTLILFQQRLSQQLDFTSGYNFQNKGIVSNDRGNHQIQQHALFASVQYKISNQLNLMPSTRIELIGNNKAEILPQINASWHLHPFQIRVSGGRSIRDADFTERYNNYNKPLVTGGSIGDPYLVPEVSWSYEAGADWFYGTQLKLSTTFFQRFQSKLIDWVSTPYINMPRQENLTPTGSYALATNIAEVNTTGCELDMQYTKKIASKQQFKLNAGMVWLHSTSSENNPSFYISSHANFLANFNLRYQIGKISVSFTGICKNRKPQQATAIDATISENYFLINGRATYSVWKDYLNTFVEVDNLFNQTYSDLLGAKMPGRWLQGGISVNWIK
ncbi:MAG: TonB-dependent receptor [Bacteroidetes bacterium]|nr:TonB-dependent receptor [Bacteroidota bacterium]MBS1739856.1 TonB-dependent receptor [Bacteroidota bacterium]